MFYYFNMFFIGSILGFVLEWLLKTFVFTSMNSSILYGPWLPVYGIGICLSIFIERLVFNKVKANRFWKIFIMFVLIMLVTSIAEFLGGIFIEAVFDKTFWDYRDLKFNLGKYVALEVAAIWGLLSLAFIYFVKPHLDKIVKKIPKLVTVLVLCIMIIDFVITLIVKA